MLEAMHSVHDATMGLQELNLDDAVAPISAIVLDQVLCELSGSFVNTFGGFGVFHNTVSRADANDDVVDDAALKQAAIEEVASVFNDSDESLARYAHHPSISPRPIDSVRPHLCLVGASVVNRSQHCHAALVCLTSGL